MFRFRPRTLLVLALGVVALAAASSAFGAESRFDASCETGQVAAETSDTGDVAYLDHEFDLAANTTRLALRAQSTVDAKDSQTLRFCEAATSFANTLTVKAGTTGLPDGAPVTLSLSVTLDGELEAFYDGPQSPEQEPPSFLAEAAVNAGFNAWIGNTPVAQFGAEASRKEWGNAPDPVYYPHGALIDAFRWDWQLTGNRGQTLGDEGSSQSETCVWPVQLPCLFTEPPPATPDYRGTHTILVDAHVGDTIAINGNLGILPQGALARARSNFPGGIVGSGLSAHFAPGPGFDGLKLALEVGPPAAGPTLSIDDASVTEGDSGTKQLAFPVHLSAPNDEPVTVAYTTQDVTAKHPDDYAAASGTLTFAPGEVEKDVVVDVAGDQLPEADETFQVTLTQYSGAVMGDGVAQGTILDDDGTLVVPDLTIDDASITEGTNGTTSVAVPIHLSAPTRVTVTLDYATSNGTAAAPGDYTASSGTITIKPGETGATILVPVVGDAEPEPDETFTIALGNVHGATVSGSGRSTVTIANDDGCTPSLTYDYVEATGCFLADGDVFKAVGPVKLDGLDLIPDAGAEIVVDPSLRHVFSRGGKAAVRAGDFDAWHGDLDWRSPPLGPNDTVKVKDLPVSLFDFTSLKGLKVKGDIKLEFDRQREARLTVPLGIPFYKVEIGKTALTGDAVLVTDNARGLHSDSLRVTAEQLPIPPVMVKHLSVSWDDLRNRWEGDATVVIPTPNALEVNAGFAFENGAFAGAHGGVDNLNAPLGNGVFLQAIRFSVEFDPLEFGGGIGVSAGPLVAGKTAVRVDGDFAVTFGDPFVVEATGKLKLVDFPLASAYFRYFSTGTVQFGGQVAIGLPDMSQPAKQPVKLAAFLDGWVGGGGFAAHGGADVYVFGVPLVGADALVSSVGAAACGRIAWLKAGFGYRWETGELSVMSGDACDVNAYAPAVPVGVNGLAPAGQVKLQLPKSDEGLVLRLRSASGTPSVTLAGPGGRSVSTGASVVNDEFVVLRDEASHTTLLAIRRPAGSWTLTPQAGSPQVTSMEQATIAADPSVSASVTGDPHLPKLSWKLSAKPGQVVRFVEEAGQVDHPIASTTDAKGSVSFLPADGAAGPRDVVAIVEQNGLPRLRTVVAHYTAPDPDDDFPGDSLARKRLGELKRNVVRAHVAAPLEAQLVGSLRAARRALRPPTPDSATACSRIGDFEVEVSQATGPAGVPADQAQAWTAAADAVRTLLQCR